MRLYLIPASGLYSKVVTTGPGLICVTCPWTSNSAYLSVSTWARSFSSSASITCCSSGRCSKLLGGNLNPPAAIRGKVVFGFAPVSARSVTSGSAASVSSGIGARQSCASALCSTAVIRSMPVALVGSGEWEDARGGTAREGINWVVTVGLAARRFSSSFCIFFFARLCCQSL